MVSHSRVFALGDVSGVNGAPAIDSLPATAQVGMLIEPDVWHQQSLCKRYVLTPGYPNNLEPDLLYAPPHLPSAVAVNESGSRRHCLADCRWHFSRQTMWPGTCGPRSMAARCCLSGSHFHLRRTCAAGVDLQPWQKL